MSGTSYFQSTFPHKNLSNLDKRCLEDAQVPHLCALERRLDPACSERSEPEAVLGYFSQPPQPEQLRLVSSCSL